MSSDHKTNIQRNNVSKIERKKRYKNPHYIPHIHSPYRKISYTNLPPMSMTTFILKLLPLFVMSNKG